MSALDELAAKTRKGDWMLTHSGIAYWPMDPRPSEVLIADIAHSLSMQCRYGGHSRAFYSVAEHSIKVSRLVPPEHALVALLHDATEAYVTDVPRPLKPFLANFKQIEHANWIAICQALDLDPVLPDCVHDIDLRICLTEMTRLMPTSPLPLGIEGEAPNIYLHCWAPGEAERIFLNRFDELWNERLSQRYPATRRAA